jgi:hypothetical protein
MTEVIVMNNAQWNTLAGALRELHRVLVERARSDYLREKQIGGEIGPGELLQLLTTDPYFEWLRSLSELMVEIDVIHDGAENAGELDEVAKAVRGAVEFFITAPAAGAAVTPFAEHYWPYVQEDPHVAMAHAGVKRALSTWPAADAASLREHRLKVAAVAHERE